MLIFRQSIKISNCPPKEAKFGYSPSLQAFRNRVVLVGKISALTATPHMFSLFALKHFYKIPDSTEHTSINSNLGKTAAVLCIEQSVGRASFPLLFQMSEFKSPRH